MIDFVLLNLFLAVTLGSWREQIMKLLIAFSLLLMSANVDVDIDVNASAKTEMAPTEKTLGPDKRKQMPSLRQIEFDLDRLRWEKFLDQMIRVNQLQAQSYRIESWAYRTGQDDLVVEFEDALEFIHRAESLLYSGWNASGGRDVPSPMDYVEQAKDQLDQAEFALDLLLELALYGY